MTVEKGLSWDELADFYHAKTGGQARIKRMEDIYAWAVKQEETIENDDTSLSFKEEK